VSATKHATKHAIKLATPPFLQVPEGGLISPRLLRAYITLARRQQPAIPPELTDYVAAHYVEARGQEAAELGERGAYITPRTLMSILRLSQVGAAGVLFRV
jgi:DNA replicative helicase MCM subunit Mcm2 (Cdc46/Mcm family)